MSTFSMSSLLLSLLALPLLVTSAPAALLSLDTQSLEPRKAVNSSCPSLHIIVARASNESPGEGWMGQVLAGNICDKIDSCDSVGIVYPATVANYIQSEGEGTAAMIDALHTYHGECPKTPIVLMGYSQGAQVVGDTICGTSSANWPVTSPLRGYVINSIIAIIQMADPSFVANQTWDVGTATTNGWFPRTNLKPCERFADITQSYCDFNDTYCASGESLVVHGSYVATYGAVAEQYVEAKYSSYVQKHAAKATGTA